MIGARIEFVRDIVQFVQFFPVLVVDVSPAMPARDVAKLVRSRDVDERAKDGFELFHPLLRRLKAKLIAVCLVSRRMRCASSRMCAAAACAWDIVLRVVRARAKRLVFV